MAYLDDHPPARSQFRDPRREQPSGVVVVHTAESILDLTGTDGGAEQVAYFISMRRDKPGSYHELADSDSYVPVVRWECEAFQDATGSNPHAMGLSFALRAADWPGMAPARVTAFLRNGAQRAAAYARWVESSFGTIIPPRRITRGESERRVPGFLSHGQRDPIRRTDPGPTFDWPQFLALYADEMTGDDDMTPEEHEWLEALNLRSIATDERLSRLENRVGTTGPSADGKNLSAEMDLVRAQGRATAQKVGAPVVDP